MRIGEGVEWALHCAVLLAVLPEGAAVPAARLAEFHGLPAAYLAKHLQALSRAGLVESVQGPRGGYRLAKPASAISVLDIVTALEGGDTAFRCTEIRQRGPAALPAREYRAACSVARVMWEAEEAWRASLRSVSVSDLLSMVGRDASPRAAVKAADWLQEVTS